MHARVSVAIVAGYLFALPVAANAQSIAGDVTLQIPLNLTKLSTDLTAVAVRCRLWSDAIRARGPSGQPTNEVLRSSGPVPVTGGQVVTTVNVVMPIESLVNPSGQTATYLCNLVGLIGGAGEDMTGDNTNPARRLTPSPGGLRGTFTW